MDEAGIMLVGGGERSEKRAQSVVLDRHEVFSSSNRSALSRSILHCFRCVPHEPPATGQHPPPRFEGPRVIRIPSSVLPRTRSVSLLLLPSLESQGLGGADRYICDQVRQLRLDQGLDAGPEPPELGQGLNFVLRRVGAGGKLYQTTINSRTPFRRAHCNHPFASSGVLCSVTQ